MFDEIRMEKAIFKGKKKLNQRQVCFSYLHHIEFDTLKMLFPFFTI